jgi:hypothetical protein
MSALLTPRPRAREERRASGQEPLFGDGPIVEGPRAASVAASAAPVADVAAPVAAPAGLTLDAAMTSLWSRLGAGEAAACPVCEAPMEPRRSAAARVDAGHCRSCGSALS